MIFFSRMRCFVSWFFFSIVFAGRTFLKNCTNWKSAACEICRYVCMANTKRNTKRSTLIKPRTRHGFLPSNTPFWWIFLSVTSHIRTTLQPPVKLYASMGPLLWFCISISFSFSLNWLLCLSLSVYLSCSRTFSSTGVGFDLAIRKCISTFVAPMIRIFLFFCMRVYIVWVNQ